MQWQEATESLLQKKNKLLLLFKRWWGTTSYFIRSMFTDHNLLFFHPRLFKLNPFLTSPLATTSFIFFPAFPGLHGQSFDGNPHQHSQPAYALELLLIHSAKPELRVKQPSVLSITAPSFPSTAGEIASLLIHAMRNLQFPNSLWTLALLGYPVTLAWLASFSTAQVLFYPSSHYFSQVS